MYDCAESHRSGRCGSNWGFTIIELLCIIGILGLLAALLLPALSHVRAKSQGALCASHKAQLTLAWLMYADDNRDQLTPNFGGDRVHAFSVRDWDKNWVNNRMTWELDAANTNAAFLNSAKLTPYTSAAASLYRCPADHVLSTIQRQAGWSARVRSISMNGMLGDPGPSFKNGRNVNNPDYVQFFKSSGIPNPPEIFVLLDEHPDSINDGYFLNVGDSDEWIDLPASYHDGATTLSFADGHCENHRWRFARTRRPLKPDAADLPFRISATQSADFDWLMAKTSVEQ